MSTSLNNGLVSKASFKGSEKGFKTSIFYVNDVHGMTSKIDQLKTAADSFTKNTNNKPDVDTFKLSAGDILIGEKPDKNNLLVKFLDLINIDLSAIGNHELDAGEKGLAERMTTADKVKYIASNLKLNSGSPLVDRVKDGKLINSTIIEKNGHKYGFIGLMPIDLKARLNATAKIDNMSVDDWSETVKNVKANIEDLKKKGIDKIIAVSHMGYDKDADLAKTVSGIDIIIGGHTHTPIQGATKGQNYLVSPTGEPVIITQASKDGEGFGVLDVEFDENGVIKSVENKMSKTENEKKDIGMSLFKDTFLGKSLPIGVLAQDCIPTNATKTENPLASFVADSIRAKSGTQLALLNGEAIRGKLVGKLMSKRTIQEIIPFQNEMYKIKLSEKDLIEALNVGAKSIQTEPVRPGLLQVSGLRYTVAPDRTVKEVYLKNADGTETKLDHTNPSKDKTFNAIYDSYVLTGGHKYTTLRQPKENVLETYNWKQEDAIVDYVKSFKYRPMNLKQDGRIIVE